MATLNGIYVFVESEDVTRAIESTTHPTETGLPITSSIREEPIEISITGRIVNNEQYDAPTAKGKIQELMTSGSLITYIGRTTANNMQIQSFDSTHNNKTWGGFEYSMTLRKVRIAKPSYVAKQATTTAQKETKAANPTLAVGATVIFKGGSVYVSSDAKKAAANRGRSTCKITKISAANWSVHQYHLISQDGGRVYGWVDKSNIEGVGTSSTQSKVNGGIKQVSNGKGTAVYHTVRSGDTVWGLVTKNYKSYGKSVQWVIDNNPSAFSRKGDAKTLKVGARLLVGYK